MLKHEVSAYMYILEIKREREKERKKGREREEEKREERKEERERESAKLIRFNIIAFLVFYVTGYVLYSNCNSDPDFQLRK